MKSFFAFLLSTCLFASLVSCRQQRYVYAASKINTPMFQKQGDVRLNGSFSFGNAKGLGDSSRNLGFDVQASVAPFRHIGFFASYYQRRESDRFGAVDFGSRRPPFQLSLVKYKRNFWEVGGGYFDTADKNVFWSVYGGAGTGQFVIEDSGLETSLLPYQRRLKTRYNRFFIQPGINAFIDGVLKADFSIRLSGLYFYRTVTNYTIDEQRILWLDEIQPTQFLPVLEPALTFSLPVPGTRFLRFEFAGSLATYNVFRNYNHDVRFWNASLGLTTDLNLKRK